MIDKNNYNHAMADGYVIHNRTKPKRHRFKYKMCWGLFNLDELDNLARKSKLFAYNSWGLMSLQNQDYINDSPDSIRSKVLAYLKQKTAMDFTGEVWLFTHPRFLGYGFNSVNFYFCYQGGQLLFIISEITNTPWGEKHLYLHNPAAEQPQNKSLQTPYEFDQVFSFDKVFHISPFMPMNLAYNWQFKYHNNQLFIKMAVDKGGVNMLNVILDTNITPLMDNEIKQLAYKRPFQPWKMSAGIYWQALKLWLKKIPFYDHPDSNTNNNK